MTEPAAGAAASKPKPRAPTFKISAAKIGSSAVAEAKKVAMKSSVIVCTMIGVRQTKRSPSPSAARLTLTAAWSPLSGRPLVCIISSARMTARNEMALTR